MAARVRPVPVERKSFEPDDLATVDAGIEGLSQPVSNYRMCKPSE